MTIDSGEGIYVQSRRHRAPGMSLQTLYNARVDGANVVTLAYLDDGGFPRGRVGVCMNELETFVKRFAKNAGKLGRCADVGDWLDVGVRQGECASVDRVEKLVLPPALRIVVGGKGSYRLCRSVYRYRLKPTIGRSPWSIYHKGKLGIDTANEQGSPGRVVTYSEKTPFVLLRTKSAISRFFAPDLFGCETEVETGRETTGGNPTKTIEELCAGLGSDKRSQTPAYSGGLRDEWGACLWHSEVQGLPAWFLNWDVGSFFLGYFMGDGSASETGFQIRATEYDEVLLVAEALFTIFECDGMEIYIERVPMDTTVGVDVDSSSTARRRPTHSHARSFARIGNAPSSTRIRERCSGRLLCGLMMRRMRKRAGARAGARARATRRPPSPWGAGCSKGRTNGGAFSSKPD